MIFEGLKVFEGFVVCAFVLVAAAPARKEFELKLVHVLLVL